MSSEVLRDDERSRYELHVDGELRGFADFEVRGDVVVLPRTVIDPAHRGSGLASELVRGALADVRRQGRTVVPACWYVAQYIERHPDEADLLAG